MRNMNAKEEYKQKKSILQYANSYRVSNQPTRNINTKNTQNSRQSVKVSNQPTRNINFCKAQTKPTKMVSHQPTRNINTNEEYKQGFARIVSQPVKYRINQ